jgi:biotin synthase
VTTSRKYEDRLATLANVREAGISVCAGGIIGEMQVTGQRPDCME